MSETEKTWLPLPADLGPAVPDPNAPLPGSKLGMHYAQCFGCGDDVDSGLRIQSTMGSDMAVISEFTVGEAHQGAPGLAHGGLLACAFDEALGTAVGNLLRQPAVTGKLETDFRQPVPVGSTLHIVAKVDGVVGRKIYVSAQGHLNSHDGPVAVQARALFVQVDAEHFAEHGDLEIVRNLQDAQQQESYWPLNS